MNTDWRNWTEEELDNYRKACIEYDKAYKRYLEEQQENNEKDMVNSPSHYNKGGYEAIDIIEALDLNFNLGNAFKYIFRAGDKDDIIQDLKKSLWYLQREINRLENDEG